MGLQLKRITVGPWPMNAYIIVCEDTGSCAVIDPGADPDTILEYLVNLSVEMIILTHGHPDHTDGLNEIRNQTSSPVYIHPEDAEIYNIHYDYPLEDNANHRLGEMELTVIHTPGHTPGSSCIDLNDRRVIVGDTIFVGGPGKTWKPEEFQRIMLTMKTKVFRWSDDTIFYPGHGPSGRIGDERARFESFITGGPYVGLYGDITWD